MDFPLFSANLRIWRFFGFIENEKRLRARIVLIMPLLGNFFQFCNIFYNWKNFDYFAFSLFMTIVLLNSLLRLFALWHNDVKFRDLINQVAHWHEEIRNCADADAVHILNTSNKRTRFFNKFSLTAGAMGGTMTAFIPLLMTERALPHPIYVPYMDVMQSPYYEIAFCMQIMWIMPFLFVTYVPFLNIYVTLIHFGIACLQHLRHMLAKIANCRSQQQMRQELRACLIYHNRIISYCKNLEDFISIIGLIELAMFTAMLAVLLIALVLNDSFIFKFTSSVYIFSILYALFVPYWFTNELAAQSLLIADAAYATNWYESNKDLSICILTMMKRSQKELQIYVGGMFPMTMETFLSLVNASYSCFTLMTNVQQK